MIKHGQMLKPLFENGKRVPHLYYDAKTNVIYLVQSIAGKTVKFSTGVKSPNILKAKREANAKLRDHMNKHKRKITSLIGEELDAWLKTKEGQNLATDTMNNVRNASKKIRGFWSDKYPHEITSDNLPLWYDWLKKEYPGKQSENAIKYMRNFSKYLSRKIMNGFPLLASVPEITDPDRKAIRAKRKKKKELIFEQADFKKIYDAANDEEKLLCLFMYTMATRIDETCNLRFDHEILLNQDPPIYRWTVGQNKADLTGEHALHSSLIEPLKTLRKRRISEGTDYLFPSRQDNQKPSYEQLVDWDGWRKRANIGWHWTSHTFRHSCLSHLFNDESNPQILICKLYRVSLAVAFETYIKPTKSGILKMQNAMKVTL